MRRRTRIILLGAAVGSSGILFLLMLLGFRHTSAHPVPSLTTLATARPVKPLSGVTVVLDPGHGGADPGTTTGPLSEAALTYRTAAELAASLRSQGAAIVYTVHSGCLDPTLALTEPPIERPSDAVMAETGKPLGLRHSPRPLWQRAGVARRVWAVHRRRDPQSAHNVFFLSLHFDQFSSADIQGGLVCVDRRSHSVPAFAKALASQMMDGDLGRHGEFHGVSDLAGRELGVLDPEYNPVPEKALLELATLSNPENAAEAGDLAWRGEIVRRITQAIRQTHEGQH